MVLTGHESGEDTEAAAPHNEVMTPFAKLGTAYLEHAQLPPRDAILGRLAGHRDHAVCDALQLKIVYARGAIIQKKHRAISHCKELLELQDLPAIPQRGLRKHPHFGQRVENDAHRLNPLNLRNQCADRAIQLHLGGVKESAFAVAADLFLDRRKLKEMDLR